jgi:histidine ammonia-lyase
MKLREAVDGLRRVLAIELLVAARALDLRAPIEPARGTGAALAAVRQRVRGPGPDEFVAAEIEDVVALVADGSVLRAVRDVVNDLQ